MSTSIHTGSPGFCEDFKNPEASALDAQGGAYDFDWPALHAALGEGDGEGIDEAQRRRLATAVSEILRWAVGDIHSKRCRNKRTELVGRRVMMLVWAVDPELLNGSSMQCLAKDCGVNKVSLSKIAVEIRGKFGISNRSQRSHDWRWRTSIKKGGTDER